MGIDEGLAPGYDDRAGIRGFDVLNEIERSIIRTLAAFAVMLMALLVFSSDLLAQSTTDGAIGGVVTDPSGAIVPGANVTARNLGTGGTVTATTEGNGSYLVGHLQPGTYSLEISAKGFAGYKATSITVEVGRVTKLRRV